MSVPTRVIAWITVCLPALALAAGPQLKLPAFDNLQKLASSSVDISIGPWPLGIAAHVLENSDPGDAEFQQLLRGLKGLYIRSYEFPADDMYPTVEVEAVREQLAAAGWNPLAQIRSHRDSEKVDVYVCMSNDTVTGLAVIASDRRKFTILNVVGSIDPQKLGALGARLGLPDLAR